MFGSSDAITNQDQDLMGIKPALASTNQAARVLPWFAGTRLLGVTWRGELFNVKTQAISNSSKKAGGAEQYNYYADFVFSISAGMADIIKRIKCDDGVVWTGNVIRGAEDAVDITIEDRGVIHFQWGTETQTLTSQLENSGQEHSPYRGQFTGVADQFYFGTANRTTPPNIQIEASRFPKPSWLTTDESIIGINSNPMAILWSWWRDKRLGLGRDESALDTTRLTAAARRLKEEGLGLSPLLTSQDDFEGMLARLLENIDGYPTSYGGLFGVELVRSGGTVYSIGRNDTIKTPVIKGGTWDDTKDQTIVKFADSTIDFQDNSAKHNEPANFRATGRHVPHNIDRPWIVDSAIANKVASAIGRVKALPDGSRTGSMDVRLSKAINLLIGAVFKLTGRDGNLRQYRVTSRTDPAPGQVNVGIEFEFDRGWANEGYFITESDEIPVAEPLEPAKAFAVSIIDSPYALSGSFISGAVHAQPVAGPSLLYMVARNETLSSSFEAYRKDNSAGGQYIAASNHRGGQRFKFLSVKAKLTVAYSGNTLPIDEIGITFQVLSPDKDLLAMEIVLGDALNHRMLALVGTNAREIMALYSIANISTGIYTAKVVRALYDTLRHDHLINTEMWIQLVERLEPDYWPPQSLLPRTYVFQTFFASGALDFDEFGAGDEIIHSDNERGLRPLAPTSLRVNGDSSGATWTVGTNTVFTWVNTSKERTVFGLAFNTAIPTDLVSLRFEFWDYAETVRLSQTTVPASVAGSAIATFSSAALFDLVGANDFAIRAYGINKDSWESLEYIAVKVRKTP